MKIYFDLDGVARSLLNEQDREDWDSEINGLSVDDYINQNLNILVDALPTEYYDVIRKYSPISFITCQKKLWIPYTEQWLNRYFENFSVIYTDTSTEKFRYLKYFDYIVEDHPKLDGYYDNVILIDRPYNKNVDCKKRVYCPEDLEKYLKLSIRLGEISKMVSNNILKNNNKNCKL